MQIQQELERTVKELKKEIESNPLSIMDKAVDILLVKTLDGEIVGFSMGLVYGGPTVYWDYMRGVSKLIASWGNERIEEYVDIDVAEDVLEELQELNN